MANDDSGTGRSERDSRQRDKDEFREDPRGGQEVSEQQPETQPSGEGGGEGGPASGDDEHGREQAGRDDPGEASGNPPSAG